MKKYIVIVILVLGICVFTYAQKMGTPILIESGNKIIDCSPPYAAPTIFDLDKDGLQDLIVGTYKGKFRFYKNKGTQKIAVYNKFSLIQANGKDALIKNW
jgi:hypothetical protein